MTYSFCEAVDGGEINDDFCALLLPIGLFRLVNFEGTFGTDHKIELLEQFRIVLARVDGISVQTIGQVAPDRREIVGR